MLAVPADSSKVESVDDLAEPGVKLAVGAESVPVGSYTREVLGRLPAGQEKAILANVRSDEPDVAASSASSPRAPPTPGSSTSPTSWPPTAR